MCYIKSDLCVDITVQVCNIYKRRKGLFFCHQILVRGRTPMEHSGLHLVASK